MGIKSFFTKIFGGSGGEPEAPVAERKSCCCEKSSPEKRAPKRERFSPEQQKENLCKLEGFVEYVVKALVDYPDEVAVSSEETDNGTMIKIVCRAGDRGKIIGKKGKTIIALRSLVAGAAGRLQNRVTVEVMDDEEPGVQA